MKKHIATLFVIFGLVFTVHAETLKYEYYDEWGTFQEETLTVYKDMESFSDAINKEIKRHGYNPNDWNVFDVEFNSVICASDDLYQPYIFMKTDAVYFPELEKISADKKKVAAKFEWEEIADAQYMDSLHIVTYFFGSTQEYNDIVFRIDYHMFPSDGLHGLIWTLWSRTQKRLIDDDDFYVEVEKEDNDRTFNLDKKIQKLRTRRR